MRLRPSLNPSLVSNALRVAFPYNFLSGRKHFHSHLPFHSTLTMIPNSKQPFLALLVILSPSIHHKHNNINENINSTHE